jgi:hypothetical protein
VAFSRTRAEDHASDAKSGDVETTADTTTVPGE